MRHWKSILSVLMFVLILGCAESPVVFTPAETAVAVEVYFPILWQFSPESVKIVDGDTIHVIYREKKLKIRLEGIDAPELAQSGGKPARQYLATLVSAGRVQILVKEFDYYGRLIARVIVDGRDSSLALLEAGHAWYYEKYCEDVSFRVAEQEARNRKSGLWAASSPEAPWAYRRRKR